MKKLRVIRFHIQPELVIDDGDSLTPLQVQPLVVAPKDWDAFASTGLQQAMANLQAQVEASNAASEK